MKTALITGINGMDGSHLADFLLDKGYKVFGVERRASNRNRVNTQHLTDKITYLQGDLSDQNSLLRCLKESNPDEVYNLGAQSYVGASWNQPEFTGEVTGLGVLRMLEAIREFIPKSNSTRLLVQKCLVEWLKILQLKLHHFTHVHPMA
jgi:GDPmannose 4,6-dehydratase